MNLADALAECRSATISGHQIAKSHLEGIKVAIDAVSDELGKTIATLKTEKVLQEEDDSTGEKIQTTDVVKQLQVQLQQVASELHSLYDKSHASLTEKYKQLDEFSIALFGRTMAGKSTLMEILTDGDGSSIGKGGQRTTRDVRSYPWKEKGLKVTDVPGIAAFEGAEDEELAVEAAQQSDLVLFLITDDAPQPAEAECLARIRSLGKPVLGICNVKITLNDADDLVYFLKKRWWSDDDQRLGALIEQFHELANKYTPGSQIYFTCTHLRSKFLSRKREYRSQRRQLEEASRFNLVEKQIISEVTGRGNFLRWKNFIDGAVVPMLQFSDCLLDFSAKNSSNGRVLTDKIQRVVSWANQFRSAGQDRIDTFIKKQMSSLRNKIPEFVEENYECSEAGDHWKSLIEEQGIECKAKELAKELQEECSCELSEISREIAAEMNLVGKLYADRRISMDSIFDTKKAWKWGTAILTTGLTIASIFTSGAVAVAAIAVNFIGSFLSLFFNDHEFKSRKQRQILTGELKRNVRRIENNLQNKLNNWFHQDLLKKQVSVLRGELNVVRSSVLKLADMQRNLAWQLNNAQKQLHKKLFREALRQIGHEDSQNLILDTARLPGHVMLLIEHETAFPEEIRKKLKDLLGEEIWFVTNSHNQASILAQAIGCDQKEIRIKSEIQVAHVPIDNQDALTIFRSGLAQQLTELHVMR